MVQESQAVPGWIDNEPYRPASTFQKVGALGNDVQVARFDKQDCVKAIESARAASQSWQATTYSERKQIFEKVIDLMRTSMKPAFEKAYAAESAVHPMFIHFNIERSASIVQEAIDHGKTAYDNVVKDGHGTHNVKMMPWGVVLAIVPWNAALILSIRAIAAPVMAGNTVVVKTSEYTPHTQLLLGELFKAAGLPKGVLNIVHVSTSDAPEMLPFLIEHPAIRKISFTGSDRVGRILGAHAGRCLKPIILELGGKAAGIICSDADLALAANNMLFGSFANCGQVCMSTERVLVMHDVYDKFKAEIMAAATAAGEAAAKSEHHPGMISIEAAKRFRHLHQQTLKDGGKSLLPFNYDSPDTTGNSHVVIPSVIEDVPLNTPVRSEEIFGPMLMLQKINTIQEGIDEINALPFGLTASVFSNDIAKAEQVAAKLDVGGAHINGPTFGDFPNVPFGGWKDSGYGLFNGYLGFLEWLHPKTISIHNSTKMPLA